jgi:GH15 family glucan-1,4-alpha-glucosidase
MPGDLKDTDGKLDYECFSWEAMEELAKVFAMAKKKYGNTDSWKLSGVDSIPTYRSALQRHLNALRKGQPDVYTEEWNGKTLTFRHSAQIMWNAMVHCAKMLEKEAQNAVHTDGQTTGK